MEPHDEELGLLNADEANAEAEATQVPEALANAALSRVSGLYARSAIVGPLPLPSLEPAPNGVRPIRREVIRLDVDGRYPQMTVSGTISGWIVTRIHWIARLTKTHPGRWTGAIWYKDGATASFPYTAVDVRAIGSSFPGGRLVKITFRGGGVPKRTVVYRFSSAYFRTVNLEFDFQAGEVADTEINTCAHPVRPASLPCENLTIPTVYRRVGCQVTTSGRTTGRARPCSSTRSSRSRPQTTRTRRRGSTGCGSGRRCTRWATPSTWPTRGRSRSALHGCRSQTSPRLAAS
jgi:hypothetical protein